MHGMIVKKNNIFKYFSFAPCMSYFIININYLIFYNVGKYFYNY
jgi:hypothetical protein